MYVFVVLCITLCSFLFCNHLEEEEKADCFAIISYRCILIVNVLWLFLAVPCSLVDWSAVCDYGIS